MKVQILSRPNLSTRADLRRSLYSNKSHQKNLISTRAYNRPRNCVKEQVTSVVLVLFHTKTGCLQHLPHCLNTERRGAKVNARVCDPQDLALTLGGAGRLVAGQAS